MFNAFYHETLFFQVESMKKQNGIGQTAALSMANTVSKATASVQQREPQPFMSLGVDPSLNSNNSSSDTSNSKSSSSGIKSKAAKSSSSDRDKSKFARELENILSKELETRRDRETKMQQYTPR